ncbi:hypothetical protein F4824DRAFT_113146 [Ustulina deusta]|nr:hypothetical protein F4824DRAFT_113146 [Ustulina deusta]
MLCCTPQTLAGGDPSTTCRPRCLSPPLASGVDLNLQAKRQTKASCTNKNSGWTSPLLSGLLSALALSPHCTTEHHTCSLSLSRSRVLRSSPDTCTHTTIRQPQDHLLFIRAREASDGRRRGAVSCLDFAFRDSQPAETQLSRAVRGTHNARKPDRRRRLDCNSTVGRNRRKREQSPYSSSRSRPVLTPSPFPWFADCCIDTSRASKLNSLPASCERRV